VETWYALMKIVDMQVAARISIRSRMTSTDVSELISGLEESRLSAEGDVSSIRHRNRSPSRAHLAYN
jgi:hypothetical protein